VLRAIGIGALAVLAAALGAVQLASSAAYGDLATRPSFPAFLHAVDPGLLRGVLGGPAAQAAAALHQGDLTTAATLIGTLPDGPVADDLRGRLAQRRGQPDAAIAAYVRAGDAVRAQALIDPLAASDPERALRDEGALVGGLHGNIAASEVTGQAWWRLGQLQAAAGYREPARRAVWWRAAESSYERALAAAPNEETYLLAAGYQSLVNGDVAGSGRWYAHAAEVVPNSADAYAGLALVAAAQSDCPRALAELARARSLRTVPVRDPIDDPLAGPPLRRCAR
jgi:tetratricopeptide (TPR) repeat protein